MAIVRDANFFCPAFPREGDSESVECENCAASELATFVSGRNAGDKAVCMPCYNVLKNTIRPKQARQRVQISEPRNIRADPIGQPTRSIPFRFGATPDLVTKSKSSFAF